MLGQSRLRQLHAHEFDGSSRGKAARPPGPAAVQGHPDLLHPNTVYLWFLVCTSCAGPDNYIS